MTHQETIENNIQLDGFMEMNKQGDNYVYTMKHSSKSNTELEYHKNWQWLMSVVEKIESITVENEQQYGVYIIGCDCHIEDREGNVITEYLSEETKTNAVYFACLNFVDWYIENKSNN